MITEIVLFFANVRTYLNAVMIKSFHGAQFQFECPKLAKYSVRFIFGIQIIVYPI